jgi:hypothetical protein
VLIPRVLRQIDDFLIRLELFVVRRICSLGDAYIEGFAAAGFAMYGYPIEPSPSREGSEGRKGAHCGKEWLGEIESPLKAKSAYPNRANDG